MSPLSIVIVGAGLGGLSCAIQCRRQGLNVLVLERAPEILEIGAGIQVPPNAGRVLQTYGLIDDVRKHAIEIESLELRRYADGSLLTERPVATFGVPWFVIHRVDYHKVLWNEAKRLGTRLRTDAEVTDVDMLAGKVVLKSGEIITGDVIVGADGLWSVVRDKLLQSPSPPFETGDLAYRATFTLEQLQALNDPAVERLCGRHTVGLWMGPGKHCVFYPIRGGKVYNLVLLRPDNLPSDVRTVRGDIDEMKESFRGWDPVVTKLLSCIDSVLKWKLFHHHELETWQNHSTTLIGDSCHPTLPYQAQGAAMAVEDGAVLGLLLGKLQSREPTGPRSEHIKQVLLLFEKLRKHRTTVNVQGAVHNRWFYHLLDGEEQLDRDRALKAVDWRSPNVTVYKWASPDYQSQLLGHDVLQEADKEFELWWQTAHVLSNVNGLSRH
ncbi:hypothetical protein BJX99DRAFT_272616 [Aspergillus californicus]